MEPASGYLLTLAFSLVLLAGPHLATDLHHCNNTLPSQNGSTFVTLQASSMEAAGVFENLSMGLHLLAAENGSYGPSQASPHTPITFDIVCNSTDEQEDFCLSSTANPELAHQHEPIADLQKDSLHGIYAQAGNTGQPRSVTHPPGLEAPIHTAASMSSAQESMQIMVIDGNQQVFFVDEDEHFSAQPPPPINTADPMSEARESTKVMVISGDNLILVDDEQFRGTTPPPGSTPIHSAAPRSVATDSFQVTVITEHAVDVDKGRQLSTHSTPPPGMDAPIHTASQRSVATESVHVMVISDEDEIVRSATSINANIDTPIQTEASRAVAAQTMQITVMNDDTMVMIKEEQLGRATPPPGDTPIHTAASRSVARNSVQVMLISDNDDNNVVMAQEGL